jgi:hypothetical protein
MISGFIFGFIFSMFVTVFSHITTSVIFSLAFLFIAWLNRRSKSALYPAPYSPFMQKDFFGNSMGRIETTEDGHPVFSDSPRAEPKDYNSNYGSPWHKEEKDKS